MLSQSTTAAATAEEDRKRIATELEARRVEEEKLKQQLDAAVQERQRLGAEAEATAAVAERVRICYVWQKPHAYQVQQTAYDMFYPRLCFCCGCRRRQRALHWNKSLLSNAQQKRSPKQ